MKKMAFFLGIFFFGFASLALTQPDPRDSVILESKSVLPGSGYPAFTMTIYITNKDSLKGFMLVYGERALEGDVRAVEHERCCQWQFVNCLTNTLRYRGVCLAFVCEPADAETVLALGYSAGSDPSTIEPPNAVRKAIWELRFDSAVGGPGAIEFDSARAWGGFVTSFTNIYGQELPVNFVKSVITVRPKGDFNLDGSLSGADVVELLNCVFDMGMPGGGAYPCDLNCDSKRSPADVILELMAVFMGHTFPC